jgi:hypothetical protein
LLLIGAASVIFVELVTGCAAKQPVTEALSDPPIVADQAMRRRTWEMTPALYAQGDVEAGTTDQLIPFDHEDSALDLLVDPAVGTVNLAITPIVMLFDWPWNARTAHGLEFPPTYYCIPTLLAREPEETAAPAAVTPAAAPATSPSPADPSK